MITVKLFRWRRVMINSREEIAPYLQPKRARTPMAKFFVRRNGEIADILPL
jgi:hypothetical protein